MWESNMVQIQHLVPLVPQVYSEYMSTRGAPRSPLLRLGCKGHFLPSQERFSDLQGKV